MSSPFFFRPILARFLLTLAVVAAGVIHARQVTVEDDDSSVKYSNGAWARTTSLDNSQTHVVPCSVNGVTGTFDIGAFVDFSFTGTAVSFYSVTDVSNRPSYSVSLDGQVLGVFEGVSPTETCTAIFSKDGLTNTTHTLRITGVTPAAGAGGTVLWTNIDKFIYTVPDAPSSTSTGPGSTSSSTPAPSSTNVAAIAGGVAGGVVLLIVVGVVLFFVLRRGRGSGGPQPTRDDIDPIPTAFTGGASSAALMYQNQPQYNATPVPYPYSQSPVDPRAQSVYTHTTESMNQSPFQITSHAYQPALVTNPNPGPHYAPSGPPSSYGGVRSEHAMSSVGGSQYGGPRSDVGGSQYGGAGARSEIGEEDAYGGVSPIGGPSAGIMAAPVPPRNAKSARVGRVQREEVLDEDSPPSYQPS